MAKMTREIFLDLDTIASKSREIDGTARTVWSNLCFRKSAMHDLKQDVNYVAGMLANAKEVVTKLELLSQLELVPYDELEK